MALHFPELSDKRRLADSVTGLDIPEQTSGMLTAGIVSIWAHNVLAVFLTHRLLHDTGSAMLILQEVLFTTALEIKVMSRGDFQGFSLWARYGRFEILPCKNSELLLDRLPLLHLPAGPLVSLRKSSSLGASMGRPFPAELLA